MRLYLVWHGESVGYANRLNCGWSQMELSEKGREQAARARERMPAVHYDRVITSDLIRAQQTAEIILPGCSYETSPLLREVSVGALAGRTAADCEAEYGDSYLEHKAQGDYTPFGGENHADLRRRVSAFFRQAEAFTEDNVAVFTHEGVLRTALELLLEQKPPKGRVACGNCTIAVFEYADGAWRLLKWDNEL